MEEFIEKVFSSIETIPPGCEVGIPGLSFEQVLQIIEKYQNSHAFKLFGVRVYPWSDDKLLLSQRPYSSFLEGSDGYLYNHMIVDYLDRNHIWYLFEGKRYNMYELTVFAIPSKANLHFIPMWFMTLG